MGMNEPFIRSRTVSPPTNASTLAWADLGERIYRAGLGWRRSVGRALETVPLTPNEFFLLRSLAALQQRDRLEGYSNQEIAEGAGVDEQTTYRAMKRLWDRGLIDRDADNRQWLNLITTSGQTILDQARPIVDAASADFFRRIVGDLVPFFATIAPLVPVTRWLPKRTRRVAPGSVW